MTDQTPDTLRSLVDQLGRGEITRRQFLNRGMALGFGMAFLASFVLNVQTLGAAPHPQDATPGASATPGIAAGPPAVGMESKTRGQDGELKILMWQAPTMMSPHVSSGTKDFLAGSLVVEPLIHYLADATMWPNLLTEIPSIENGGVSSDLTTITLKLMPDVLWSDGTPFTAADVVFTHDWVVNPDNASVNADTWGRIGSIEAVDDLTVKVTYPAPNVTWFSPFAGYSNGPIYPKHYIEANGGDIMKTAPIGTGPYVVKNFSPNDQILYDANPNYREPNKPAFAGVNMKGGGDPNSVAQAVLQTGDWDFAWNVTIEPGVVKPMLGAGYGSFRVTPSASLERININWSDPNKAGPDGQRSYWKNPHPFLTDPVVRQAMALGIDRKTILDQFYAPPGEKNTSNLLNGIPPVWSDNTSWEFNPDKAGKILDDAGWKMNGSVREKDGVALRLTYATSIASVRQKTQQVVKANLSKIGFQVNLQQIDSGIYFDSSPGNTQNTGHMYWDIDVYTNSPATPVPTDYMSLFYAGKDGANIAQASNQWHGTNYYRYNNPDYDALYEKLLSGAITDIDEVNNTLIQLNDIVMKDNAIIPLINAGGKYCVHKSLVHGDLDTGEDNGGAGGLDGTFWNIANWNRAEPVDR